jgi:glycosyltransferase involved in cell wall biosynthesis
MNIGFDAKRAFHNGTGLGHYSRTLIRSLAQNYPEHQYYLFNPKVSERFQLNGKNLTEVRPATFIGRLFPSYWRSSGLKNDLTRLKIDIYHGLSHEIPRGMARTGIHSVVTIHDLIHERYPEQYPAIDVQIYRYKFRYACQQADRIIAVSEQTKSDIVNFYHIPEHKVRVTYQSCDPAFALPLPADELQRVKKKYRLPESYFLYVGSLISRKNLLGLCSALARLKSGRHLPLVVIGDGGGYKKEVKQFLHEKRLTDRVIFLSEEPIARQSAEFQTAAVFPAIYQMATAFIYPSFFEGFGIPVLEALWSGIPVITSPTSCLPEVGGEGALYVDPADPGALAEAMDRLIDDVQLRETLVAKGRQQALRFTAEACASKVMAVYRELS